MSENSQLNEGSEIADLNASMPGITIKKGTCACQRQEARHSCMRQAAMNSPVEELQFGGAPPAQRTLPMRHPFNQITQFELASQLHNVGAVVVSGLENAAAAADWIVSKTGCDLILQPQGGYFSDVKPNPKFLDKSDAQGIKALPPHSDGSSEEIPPAIVCLFCLHQAGDPEPTLVVNFEDFLRTTCSRSEIEWLTTKTQKWSHSLENRGKPPVLSPVITYKGGFPLYRWSHNLLLRGESSPTISDPHFFCPDPVAVEIAMKLDAYLQRGGAVTPVFAETGDLVVIENRRRLHFRGPLKCMDRSFVRFWAA